MAEPFPEGWRLETIEEAMEMILDYRGVPPPKSPSGVPLVTAKIVKQGRLLPPDEFVAHEDYDGWMRRGLPQSGDVVITTEAPLGEVARLDERKVALGQRTITLRGKTNILDNGFLRYVLQSTFVREQLHSRSTGTTVLGIRQSELRQVQLPIPPIAEQNAIAHILGTLDDEIELNRRMSETLEAMARALFKSWFVDFDPVRAKAEGRDPGLPKPLADLFPDSFEESKLGEAPKGWRLMPLPDVIDVNPTRALRKGIEAPYLDMANMPIRGHSPDDVICRAVGSGMRFVNGDTLVARITPCLENGKTAFVDFLDPGQVGWGSTEYIVLRPKPPFPDEFAYCLARSTEFRDFAIQSMTGTSGRQRVPSEALSHFRVVAAPRPVAELFGRLIKPLFARASAATKEGRTLAALRDALLPKLISGELRVRDATRFSERAAS